MSRKVISILVFLLIVFSPVAGQEKSYDAERFDILVRPQADRSLLVEETVTFRFRGGPFSYVFRELPTDYTDGIVDIVAAANGEVWPQGSGPNQVEISGNNPIEVVWHLPPTSNTDMTFTLTYQAMGVVRQEATADVIDWQALPDNYEYAIESSRLTIDYPPGAALMTLPEVLAGDFSQTTNDTQTIFDGQNLSPGDPLVVRLTLQPGLFSATPPEWQASQDKINSQGWMWITAAATTLIGGLVTIFITTRSRYPRGPKSTTVAYKPPYNLPPALVGYLLNNQISWQHALGTLFDLAGRGFINITQTRELNWYKQAEFDLTYLEQAGEFRPHEAAFLNLLFTDKSGIPQETITMSRLGRLITSSRWKTYSKSLEMEAEQEGLIDPETIRRSKQITVTGIILMVMAIPLFIAAFLLQNMFGFWPLFFIAALFIVGIVAAIAGASMSILSQRGSQIASAYDAFRQYLKAVSKGKAELPDPSYYETYLPYTAAFGFAEGWVKRQEKSGYENVPAYFRAMENAQALPILIIAISNATHSGGAAGSAGAGAAGAGAAGGGASGAG